MMKGKILKAVFLGLMVMALFAGCRDVVSSSVSKTPKAGSEGTVVVSFSTGRAALAPSGMDFDVYKFIFKKGEAETAVTKDFNNKDETFTFTLATGTYTLYVEAYADGVLAAKGTSDEFTVVATGTTPVTVRLAGQYTAGGEGLFTYAITYPNDAKIDKLYLNSEAISSTADSGEITLPAGFYFLVIQLSRGKETAGYANGVNIYPGQTTNFTRDFTDEEFGIPPFTGDPVTEWKGFNVPGTAGAKGTEIEYYIDSDGDYYKNVLLLEAPDGGYTDGDMALTYTADKAGTYYISMWYLVEDGDVDIIWQKADGSIFAFEFDDDGNLWIHYTGSIELLPDDVIGLLVNGLGDATIYIRNLEIQWGENEIRIIEPVSSLIAVGDYITLETNFINAFVEWSSDTPAVATVDANGKVTAIGNGTAVIRATSVNDDDNFDEITITVFEASFNVIVLQWDTASFSFITTEDNISIIRPTGKVTLQAPEGNTYQWYVDGKAVAGATSQTFVFDSAKYLPKTYNISLKVGNNGGDAIQITVTE